MRLGELIHALKTQSVLSADQQDREVADISHDSRLVQPGSLFVAVRGFHSDGHRFIAQAVERGAAAVVAETEDAAASAARVPQILVEDSRKALAQLAGLFYGHPSRKLSLIGVTGTNGKTTTTHLVKSIIEAAGSSAGLIGTIEYRIGDRRLPAPNTTPESLELQRFLAEMVAAGAEYCVMEVSSHALELGRTDGCVFAAAAFTNLTQDHLDFHGTMDAYFRAKLGLFAGLTRDQHAVVNLDDERAADIISNTRGAVITTGMSDRAAIRPSAGIRHGLEGLSFSVETPRGAVSVQSPLVGRHNVYNILTAIGIATALGFGTRAIEEGIRAMHAVPGRLEKVDAGQPFGVVVDYAHTEDALVRLLDAAREITRERVITVFGCGGDRDRTKRPRMGAAALRSSDIVIVTSDNPRSEDPDAILRDIEAGMRDGVRASSPDALRERTGRTPYLMIPDRRHAIAAAVRLAQPGDLVVLAGKGHEGYQIIGESRVHFDDREVAREEIANVTAARGGARPAPSNA
jgi:UDP-N-acetylmuramoyl-L-alanyl-D-glutamate--2,6-diaminopimelate ligase